MRRLPRQASTDQRDRAEKAEPTLAAEQTESTDANDPTEPIDRMDPLDPIDRIDPLEPMDRMDPLEPMDRIDPLDPRLRIFPELSSFRMGSLWTVLAHCGRLGGTLSRLEPARWYIASADPGARHSVLAAHDDDGARRVMHAVTADRPEQGLG